MAHTFSKHTLSLTIDGTALSLSALYREGPKAPIVFLHGFGSSKDEYADIARHTDFDGHAVIAFDAPGCGETHCADQSKVSIAFQIATAQAVLEHYNVQHFHLVGHSMGGLAALLLAHSQPERVLSFTDIKGNLSPEDCFLSRQIFEYPSEDDERFFTDFIERTRLAPEYSCALYASSLRQKVQVEAIRGIFSSMVELSDNAALMDKFLAVPCPKMFMFGEQYDALSYLPLLRERGVRLARIPFCGHFPMYANPPRMWAEISAFMKEETQA